MYPYSLVIGCHFYCLLTAYCLLLMHICSAMMHTGRAWGPAAPSALGLGPGPTSITVEHM